MSIHVLITNLNYYLCSELTLNDCNTRQKLADLKFNTYLLINSNLQKIVNLDEELLETSMQKVEYLDEGLDITELNGKQDSFQILVNRYRQENERFETAISIIIQLFGEL